MSPPELDKQILVAGVGNAWLQDVAFGGEVARRTEKQGVPSGVTELIGPLVLETVAELNTDAASS